MSEYVKGDPDEQDCGGMVTKKDLRPPAPEPKNTIGNWQPTSMGHPYGDKK